MGVRVDRCELNTEFAGGMLAVAEVRGVDISSGLKRPLSGCVRLQQFCIDMTKFLVSTHTLRAVDSEL